MIFEPRATDFSLVDIESALLRAAVGDYAAEAAVLLLATGGHWLPQLRTAGLIVVDLDREDDGAPTGEPPALGWAAVAWADLDGALRDGVVTGDGAQLRLLRAAASIADGQPVDLGDLTANLDRRSLTLLLAALAHAAGSHAGFGSLAGEPLVPWPTP